MVLTINGIKFRSGEVTWQAPYSITRTLLPTTTSEWSNNPRLKAPMHTAVGLVGRFEDYYIVITEREEDSTEYDYTVIPRLNRATVKYQEEKRLK
jgi:hypothetical protein